MTVLQERAVVDTRTVLDAETWGLLAGDVRRKNPDMTAEFADRGVSQMVAFLVAGTLTAAPLSPSQEVDAFWHAFVLRTEAYAAFCARIAGYFIHHAPDVPGSVSKAARVAQRDATLEAITMAGFTVDPELWPTAAECSQCHEGCSDSPVGGKK